MNITLNGYDLTLDQLSLLMSRNSQITISDDAWERIKESNQKIRKIFQEDQDRIVYGVSTGFGSLRNKYISKEMISKIQVNLIKSHAVGVGKPLSHHLTRGMFILRLNSLIRGYSGVRPELISYLVDRFNQGIFCKVPIQGSVGASGDLAPLSHLFVGYLGEGEMYDPETESFSAATEILNKYQIPLMILGPKEGLALTNGTAFMTVHLADAVYKSKKLSQDANVIAGLTLEGLNGTHRAFHPGIHQARNQEGQIYIASEMRKIFDQSNTSNDGKVQDAYSLRCIPQVHGAVYDTLKFVEGITIREMNATTDNPVVIGDDLYSGGNFHGQYPAMMADHLSTALITLGNISERRIERLVNSSLSGHPSFLVPDEAPLGINSGYMIVQYVAAALAAENRTLSNPGSVHSIPTCENFEDHVSMGAFSVRKLQTILKNVQKIVALELLLAVQAKSFVPTSTSPGLENLIKTVREHVPPLVTDRYMESDIAFVIDLVEKGQIYQIFNQN